MDKYVPINCEFHDLLEDSATRRKRSIIEYVDDHGQAVTKQVVIADVKSQSGAEHLFADDGTVIRLDRLIAIDGKKLCDF